MCSMTPTRTPYPTNVSDEEWAFVAMYLLMLPQDAGQRTYSLRAILVVAENYSSQSSVQGAGIHDLNESILPSEEMGW